MTAPDDDEEDDGEDDAAPAVAPRGAPVPQPEDDGEDDGGDDDPTDYPLPKFRRDYGKVRDQTLSRARSMWGLGGGTPGTAQHIASVVTGGQQLVSQMAQLYASNHLGAKFTPFLPGPSILQRPGVSPVSVYMRPARELGSAAQLNRLDTLVQTDLQLAKTRTLYSAFDQDQNVNREPIKIYRRVTGGNPCALCEIAADNVYFSDDLLPIHDNCIGPASLVRVPTGHRAHASDFGDCVALTRRQFTGQLVELSTASGNHLSVTANHPILTDKGWLPAVLLCKGDNVFRCGVGQWTVDGRPQPDQHVARIEDLFDAAWRKAGVGTFVRMPLSPKNFHGDDAEGEVDIVWADRNLTPVRNTLARKHLHEHRLVAAGGLGITLPGGSQFESGSDGPKLTFDAPPDKFGSDSATGYAKRGRALQNRLAGQIERDSVVECRRVNFSGHVYNLQTVEGWYVANSTSVSSGIVTSNCECDVEEDDGERLRPDQLEKHNIGFVENLLDTGDQKGVIGALADEDAPPEAYHNLVAVRQHGELGPVLTWKGQTFTGPGDLPEPIEPRSPPPLPGTGSRHEQRLLGPPGSQIGSDGRASAVGPQEISVEAKADAAATAAILKAVLNAV